MFRASEFGVYAREELGRPNDGGLRKHMDDTDSLVLMCDQGCTLLTKPVSGQWALSREES